MLPSFDSVRPIVRETLGQLGKPDIPFVFVNVSSQEVVYFDLYDYLVDLSEAKSNAGEVSVRQWAKVGFAPPINDNIKVVFKNINEEMTIFELIQNRGEQKCVKISLAEGGIPPIF